MRYADWQERMFLAFEVLRPQPFEYGKCDCVLFAAQVADAITVDGGYVERAKQAFTWTNEAEALKLTRETALSTLVQRVLGPPIKWTKVGAGDIMMIFDARNQFCLTVHDGHRLVAKVDKGLGHPAIKHACFGWSVS